MVDSASTPPHSSNPKQLVWIHGTLVLATILTFIVSVACRIVIIVVVSLFTRRFPNPRRIYSLFVASIAANDSHDTHMTNDNSKATKAPRRTLSAHVDKVNEKGIHLSNEDKWLDYGYVFKKESRPSQSDMPGMFEIELVQSSKADKEFVSGLKKINTAGEKRSTDPNAWAKFSGQKAESAKSSEEQVSSDDQNGQKKDTPITDKQLNFAADLCYQHEIPLAGLNEIVKRRFKKEKVTDLTNYEARRFLLPFLGASIYRHSNQGQTK